MKWQTWDQIVMQDIFSFRQSGVGSDGRVMGELLATGAVPTWIDQVRSRGMEIDRGIFAG